MMFPMGTPYEWKSSKSREGMVSVFGRVNYNYGDRYLVTGTIRGDGSSKFAKGNQWGFSPRLLPHGVSLKKRS